MPRIKLLILSILITITGVAGCGGDDGGGTTAPVESTKFTFSLNNFSPLDSAHYKAWALIGQFGYPLGVFDINPAGQMVDTSGAQVAGNSFSANLPLEDIDGIGVTVEPDDGSTTGPTALFLGGAVSGGSTTISVGHGAGLGEDFSGISGKYILATPTDGTDSDEFSGIWFLDNSSGVAVSGLTLTDISLAGWKYQGWVNVGGTYISTGTFSSPTARDDSANYSGSQTAPSFPGEDFLNNAPDGVTFPLDLRGQTALITMELFPDPAPAAPSPFVLLQANVPPDAADHQTYQFEVVATGSLPSATVTVTAE
ncbi:MAG: hypothetical protein FVQ81_12110 [Candidatus Glassbacteria bacterium]|nr:hypothetical protein [Candidatus Glassbacteria bacterium]